jgi:predicted DNA-binding transcriptional regulator AlpA
MSKPGHLSGFLELLTVADVLRELQVARSTFYAWKAKGIAPNWRKLPNGELRISRHDLLTWYESLEVAN